MVYPPAKRIQTPEKNELLPEIPVEILDQLNIFVTLLKTYNKEINLISRKVTEEEIIRLIQETIYLDCFISGETVIDVGSGNGLLAIPIAVIHINKKIYLVESRKKKALYLQRMIDVMDIKNAWVKNQALSEFMREKRDGTLTLVSRGFPNIGQLMEWIKKKIARELVVITGIQKIKKMVFPIEKTGQKIYNIPFRKDLKILKLECFT